MKIKQDERIITANEYLEYSTLILVCVDASKVKHVFGVIIHSHRIAEGRSKWMAAKNSAN
jgi:hypothetical protein